MRPALPCPPLSTGQHHGLQGRLGGRGRLQRRACVLQPERRGRADLCRAYHQQVRGVPVRAQGVLAGCAQGPLLVHALGSTGTARTRATTVGKIRAVVGCRFMTLGVCCLGAHKPQCWACMCVIRASSRTFDGGPFFVNPCMCVHLCVCAHLGAHSPWRSQAATHCASLPCSWASWVLSMMRQKMSPWHPSPPPRPTPPLTLKAFRDGPHGAIKNLLARHDLCKSWAWLWAGHTYKGQPRKHSSA